MKKINQQFVVIQQKFLNFYQRNLREIYTQLEPVRHEKIHSVMIRAIVVSAIILFVWCLCHIGFISAKVYESNGFIKLCVFFLLGAAYLIYEPFEAYRTTTKTRVMKIILSFWGKFTYSHEKDIIGDSVINKSGLFARFNETEVDDAFEGRYKDVKIDVSEHDVMVHGNKGNVHIFKGILIMFDFPKKFKGQTVLIHRWFNMQPLWNNSFLMFAFLGLVAVSIMPFYFILKMAPRYGGLNFTDFLFMSVPMLIAIVMLGLIYWLWQRKNLRRDMQKVVLEGLPFMRQWKIFTDNQVQAQYILTPEVMEKIAEIKHLFYGKAIDFSFFGNKLLIAVHTRKNLFETASLFVPALSYYKMREVVMQLHSIFSIVDVINGNEN